MAAVLEGRPRPRATAWREHPSSPRHACFFSQQAAEKALKAALVLEGIDVPFTHDLDALRNLLPESSPVRVAHADLAELTEWGVEARYPGDWPEPSEADARRAESDARDVYESVAEEFRRRGSSPGALSPRRNTDANAGGVPSSSGPLRFRLGCIHHSGSTRLRRLGRCSGTVTSTGTREIMSSRNSDATSVRRLGLGTVGYRSCDTQVTVKCPAPTAWSNAPVDRAPAVGSVSWTAGLRGLASPDPPTRKRPFRRASSRQSTSRSIRRGSSATPPRTQG